VAQIAQIAYSARALDDIERAFEFLAERDPGSAAGAAAAIQGAVGTLAEHPLIGRSVTGGLRELVISFGKTGYVALYWFSAERPEIWVLGIRHQRELDYPA
jgi:plasmid stabilization system protein ParE